VGAVNITDAARHATGRVVGEGVLEFVLGRAAQVGRLLLVDDEVVQASGCLCHGRRPHAAIFVRAVVQLPVAQHPQGRQQLLDGVRLQPPGCFNPASPPRLIAHGRAEPLENCSRHAMALLQISLAVDERLPADPKVVAYDIVRAQVKFAVSAEPSARARTTERALLQALAHGQERPPDAQASPIPKHHSHVQIVVK